MVPGDTVGVVSALAADGVEGEFVTDVGRSAAVSDVEGVEAASGEESEDVALGDGLTAVDAVFAVCKPGGWSPSDVDSRRSLLFARLRRRSNVGSGDGTRELLGVRLPSGFFPVHRMSVISFVISSDGNVTSNSSLGLFRLSLSVELPLRMRFFLVRDPDRELLLLSESNEKAGLGICPLPTPSPGNDSGCGVGFRGLPRSLFLLTLGDLASGDSPSLGLPGTTAGAPARLDFCFPAKAKSITSGACKWPPLAYKSMVGWLRPFCAGLPNLAAPGVLGGPPLPTSFDGDDDAVSSLFLPDRVFLGVAEFSLCLSVLLVPALTGVSFICPFALLIAPSLFTVLPVATWPAFFFAPFVVTARRLVTQ